MSSEQIADSWLSFALSLWIYGPSSFYDSINGDIVKSREYALTLLGEKTLTECQTEEDRQQSSIILEE